MQKIFLKFNPIKKKTELFDGSNRNITEIFSSKYNYTDNSLNTLSSLLNKEFFANLLEYCNNGISEPIELVFYGIIVHYDAIKTAAEKWYGGIVNVTAGEVISERLSGKIESFLIKSNLIFSSLENSDKLGDLVANAADEILSLKNDDGFNIFVTGSTNSGKSAFVNSLLGTDLMPVSSSSCTSISYRIIKSDSRNISFTTNIGGKITVDADNGFKIKSEKVCSIASLLDNVIGNAEKTFANIKENVDLYKNRILAKIISYINYLPKSENERIRIKNEIDYRTDNVWKDYEQRFACAPAILENEYVSGFEVVINFPIVLKLGSDEKFTINDTPGHTDSANDGEHFEKLKNAIKNDKSNTVLMFVTRPDNPSTVDNANLIDTVYSVNKSLDPDYSFFIVSHADAIGQNKMNTENGELFSEEERLGEFDRLIENNKIKCKNCVINFKDRNVFFIDSYKSMLTDKFPDKINEDGFIEYELHFTKKGAKEISSSYLPYYAKNRIGTGDLYSEEIAGKCEEILKGSGDNIEKARVRTGLYSVELALNKYLDINYDIIKSKKLYDGALSKTDEILTEITRQMDDAVKIYNDCKTDFDTKKQNLLDKLFLILSTQTIIFNAGDTFSAIENNTGKKCLELLQETTKVYHGINKEQFIELYNKQHPDTNLISLKGIKKDRINELKDEVKNDIINNKLNNLYLNTIIDDFFSAEELSGVIRDYKLDKLNEIYDTIAKMPEFAGIGECKKDYVSENLSAGVKERAANNLIEREVSLDWNNFSGFEKIKNSFIGVFNPKNKKYITQKLEVDEKTQSAKIKANWEKVEESINLAVADSFKACEYEAFKTEMLSDAIIDKISALSVIKDKKDKYKAIIDSFARDEKKLASLRDEIDLIYRDLFK